MIKSTTQKGVIMFIGNIIRAIAKSTLAVVLIGILGVVSLIFLMSIIGIVKTLVLFAVILLGSTVGAIIGVIHALRK